MFMNEMVTEEQILAQEVSREELKEVAGGGFGDYCPDNDYIPWECQNNNVA